MTKSARSTSSSRRALRTLLTSIVALCLLAASACSDDDGSISKSTTTGEGATSTPATVVLPEHRSFIATVNSTLASIDVFAAPGGGPLMGDVDNDGDDASVSFPNPLPSGATTTFLVKTADQMAPNGELFHEVYLPTRPNGVAGFVRATDVVVSHTDLAAVVDLSDHTLTLTSDGDELETFTIAAGTTETPTPTGLFYVKELIEPTNEDGAYGPLAFGLSAYSEVVLDTEAFQDGVIGIHGTNQPELLGTDVSHGCIRLSNDDVLRLEELKVPLGMPVTIQA